MRNTNFDFFNTLTPKIVRFEASPVGGSLAFLNQTPFAIYLNVPANFVCKGNPTKELFDRLSELKSKYSTALMPNSVSPNEASFENAKDFVLTLPLHRIMKPAIHIASDGEVNFQWSGPDFEIDLGFYGDGKFSFYGAKTGHDAVLGDAVSVKDGIPKELVDFASAG